MPIKHAKLSASGSSRWLNCPGSVKASEKYKNGTSKFAEEGTCAHELGEICLKSFDKNPSDYLGQTLNDAPDVTVDSEMVEHVEGYISYCRQFDGDMFVEEQVDFSQWVPDGFGTSDCIVIGDVVHVIDLKYGKGVEVYAEKNSQAMLYALGVLNEYDCIYDFDDDQVFRLHIYQPRRAHFDAWDTTKRELMGWAQWVKERADLALNDDAPMVPGDKQCQWCPHKANCVALQKFTEDIITAEFENLDLPQPEKVDIVNVLKHKSLIESWLKSVEQVVFEKLLAGEHVEGFKLVEGRSNRKWGDEQIAIDTLTEHVEEEKLYTRKFVTVPQAEKLIGKAEFNTKYGDLVIKPEGKPTLAPSSDKRPPIGDVSDCFEKLDN
ncbi:protein of unknown function DUF2800 [Vibrio phage LP.1]|nr:protein of unknown function DUF2800 [Vibrio phage LP.1]